MEKLTKEQAVVISAFTGVLICEFSHMHAEVERRLGRPVFTHEFASDALSVEIKEVFKHDFVSMQPTS